MSLCIQEIIQYFIIYACIGWLMESIVRSFCEKKIINTGFFIGPICPIYGIGAILMLLFLSGFKNKPILLFFISLITLTVFEYVVGIILEKIFKTKYWDYSNSKFNFQGRICLVNSLCWGFLGVVLILFIHPIIKSIVGHIDNNVLFFFSMIIMIIFVIDLIISIIKIKNMKVTLNKIDKYTSEIKEKLNEINILKNKNEKRKTIEKIQRAINHLITKRDKTIENLTKTIEKLKRNFPAFNTKEIAENLNKKIEKIKGKKSSKKEMEDLK